MAAAAAAPAACPPIKLYYFALDGLGLAPRTLLRIGGLSFEDIRYPISFVDGKAIRPEFDAAKAAGTFPFGQVPVLQVGDEKICQSRAIERFIAGKIGLLGANNVDTALIEGFGEQILDARTAYYKAQWTQGEEAKKAAKEAFYATELSKHLTILENAAGDRGHFTCKLSLADVQFYGFIEAMDQAGVVKAHLTAHPKLNKIYNNVAELPAVVVHKQCQKPTYKLTYFDIRGYAETSRYLLKIAGIPFEDIRYPIAFVDGKAIRPEFDVAKASGAFPFGQVPVLEVSGAHGVKIAQSRAIERFIAREAGLLGACPVESAKIDEFGEQVLDMRSAFFKAYYTQPEDAKKAALETFFSTDLPKQLGLIEAVADNDGFLVGKKLSLADVQLYSALEGIGQDNVDKAVAANPKVKKVFDYVSALPAVAKWRSERKVTFI